MDVAEKLGFEILARKKLEEVGGVVTWLRHTKSGAEVVSIVNKDENKVFGVSFRTPALDDTGLPHILEHLVFNGSRKYPIKDPFVELHKGSVASFMNAFTYPDKTCYPVASINTEDLYNLADVYWDAVFYPLLKEEAFGQEGWRYVLENEDDDLQIKGIVFNEMKGVFANPESILSRREQSSLFPDTEYKNESGGHPDAIPSLTLENLKDYHRKYYHPSNGLFYFWGNDDEETRLGFLAEKLEAFQLQKVTGMVHWQTPRKLEAFQMLPYATEDKKEKGYWASQSWLLGETTDLKDRLIWEITEYVLLGTSAGVLRRKLIESGMGTDLTTSGVETEQLQMSFGVGMKGLRQTEIEKFFELLQKSLEEIAESRLPEKLVEAGLNQLEFEMRENNTGNYPQGLSVMLWILKSWLYSGNAVADLEYNDLLKRLREEVDLDKEIRSRIRAGLLENDHWSRTVLEPKPGMQEAQEKNNHESLQSYKQKLDTQKLQELVAWTKQVDDYQNRDDSQKAREVLPSLRVEDLARKGSEVVVAIDSIEGVEVVWHESFTNGLVYMDWAFTINDVPDELVPYLGIWKKAVLECGTQERDFVDLITDIDTHTGGISTQIMASEDAKGNTQAWLLVRGKSLVSKVDVLAELMLDLLQNSHFNNKQKLNEVVNQKLESLKASLLPSGHSVVHTRLEAKMHGSGKINEMVSGIEQMELLEQFAGKLDETSGLLVEKLHEITRLLITQASITVGVTVETEDRMHVQKVLEASLSKLPKGNQAKNKMDIQLSDGNEAVVLSVGVSYVGKGWKLGTGLSAKEQGEFQVVNNWLKGDWLWDAVRVKGGAYGGFSILNSISGSLSLLSYRDPSVGKTLDVFDELDKILREGQVSQWTQERLIISVIGAIDQHKLVDQKGLAALLRHLTGITPEYRQQVRDGVFEFNQASLQRLVDRLQGAPVVISMLTNDTGWQEAQEKVPDIRMKRLQLG